VCPSPWCIRDNSTRLSLGCDSYRLQEIGENGERSHSEVSWEWILGIRDRIREVSKRGASQTRGWGSPAKEQGGLPNVVMYHRASPGSRRGSKNTSFVYGLRHPEQTLHIAPRVSKFSEGFVNALPFLVPRRRKSFGPGRERVP